MVWGALLNGDIDAYVEYTGTITQEIFAGQGIETEEQMRDALGEKGIRMAAPLGFNNTYAIGMKEDVAERLGVATITDLKRHSDIEIGFGNEFMNRGDGWPALRDRYGLQHQNVRGMDHRPGLSRPGKRIHQGHGLCTRPMRRSPTTVWRTLRDDLSHFPVYNASIIYRADLEERYPEVIERLPSVVRARPWKPK